MKLLLISFFFIFSVEADEKFFKEKAIKDQKKYVHTEYEDIISGGIAFVVGNVGFFTTESTPLRAAYSVIQTVGIINISDGIYESYNPSKEKYYYSLFKKYPGYKDKEKNQRYFSKNIIWINAQEEKDRRLSRFYGSTFLATQYVINTLDDRTSSDLKSIYLFLAGVNMIVAGNSWFTRGDYEKHMEDTEKLGLFQIFPIPDGLSVGMSSSF